MKSFSFCLHIYINNTYLNVQFIHLRITLLMGFPVLTKTPPMHIWCQFIPQACLVLNLLRQSRINPKLSAYAQVPRAYDFNSTPVAPLGTRVVLHEKQAVRISWEIRVIDVWYLGQALHHYRCFEVFAKNTDHSCISDTVKFPASLYHVIYIISRQCHWIRKKT